MKIAVENFVLDPDHRGTLQRQMQDMVIQGVLSGRFSPGDKLPSSRALAYHLGLSRITITLAYTELVANDYVSSRGRSGYYISDSAPQPISPLAVAPPTRSTVDWTRILRGPAMPVARVERPSDWRSYRYPFIYGQPDPRLFDHQSWRRCALEALGQRDFSALAADAYMADDADLVDQIIRLILPRRGISAHPEEVMITLGAQNALWTVAQTLLTQRRTAVMEDPGYPELREILVQSRCNLLPVPAGAEGLDLDAIPEDTDVVFTTPSHHCPTAVTLPTGQRRRLLAKAAAEDFVVVEDDYEFELGYMQRPSPALKSLDREGRVIYIGSFSKSLFPGLRLGFIVAPEPVIREARALRHVVLRHPPGHIQRTVAYYLGHGHYDAQIQRAARAFKSRRAVMDEALQAQGLAPATVNGFGGSSIWMQAPEGVDSAELATRLRDKSVLIEPGSSFFARDSAAHRRFYRLGYSSIAEKDIPAGIAHLAAAL